MKTVKKPSLLASCLGLGLMSLSAQAALVHHYTFDDLTTGGNATDSVGGATGVWDGDASQNIAATGILGTASQTNDENGGNGQEHYTIGSLSGLDGATAMTISLWFNLNVETNNNSTYDGLFMTRNVNDGDAGQNYGLALLDNASPFGIDSRVSGDNGDGQSVDSVPGSSAWHHIAMTWDSTTGNRALYLDGVQVNSGTSAPTGAIVTAGSWDIGNDTCCGSREFTGTLDDIAVWNEELNSQQVANLYNGAINHGLNAPLAVPEPSTALLAGLGLVGLLRRRRS